MEPNYTCIVEYFENMSWSLLNSHCSLIPTNMPEIGLIWIASHLLLAVKIVEGIQKEHIIESSFIDFENTVICLKKHVFTY